MGQFIRNFNFISWIQEGVTNLKVVVSKIKDITT